MILWAIVTKIATIWPPMVGARLSLILGCPFPSKPLPFSFLDLALAGVDVLVIGCRLHLRTICTCRSLRDLVLLLGEF